MRVIPCGLLTIFPDQRLFRGLVHLTLKRSPMYFRYRPHSSCWPPQFSAYKAVAALRHPAAPLVPVHLMEQFLECSGTQSQSTPRQHPDPAGNLAPKMEPASSTAGKHGTHRDASLSSIRGFFSPWPMLPDSGDLAGTQGQGGSGQSSAAEHGTASQRAVYSQCILHTEQRISTLDATLFSHTNSPIHALLDKIDDLENCSRRNNLWVIGLPEPFKTDSYEFCSSGIPEALGLPHSFMVEQVHQVGSPFDTLT